MLIISVVKCIQCTKWSFEYLAAHNANVRGELNFIADYLMYDFSFFFFFNLKMFLVNL